jgi:hypothetical protein
MLDLIWLRDHFFVLNFLNDEEVCKLMENVINASKVTQMSVEEILRLIDSDVEHHFAHA